jgi:hypothetical protein
LKNKIAYIKRSPSLLKQRYAENPFATAEGFRVPIRNKTEVIQTDAPAAITVGEERVAIAQIRRITTVDSDPFVKLFTAELNRFFDLTPGALRIVTILIKDIGNIRLGDGDQVYITEKSIAETMEANGIPAPSTATYYRAMEELISKGFVAPSTNAPLYFINPAIFFNGDRVRFVTEIRRKRLTAQEKLEAAGQKALPLDAGPSDQTMLNLDHDPETGEVAR